MTIQTLTVVGVGLLGGSLGLAAKQHGLARRVLGFDLDPETLDFARYLGAIDEGRVELADAVREAEVAVFCTPVDQIARQVLTAASACAAGALLTDVGSTKAAIVRDIDGRLPAGVAFVGSHPLAGSEKRGPEHANARLFERRLTVITPTPQTDAGALRRTRALWEGLGSRVRELSPEDHDRALALTSHLPHLTAAALAGILPPELAELTATGFRDTTRVAAGDPGLWTAIFAQNRSAVLDGLRLLAERLAEFGQALEAGDDAAMDRLLTQAKKVRDALGN
jgi:cyclohexadieny/prephenate dehydrogenase